MDESKVENKLNDLMKIGKSFSENEYIKNAPVFNIFDVLGVGNKEVVVCRFLAWLLNPRASHGKNDLFLKTFLQQVLFKNEESKDVNLINKIVKDVVVETEYNIGSNGINNRRIDIVIYNKYFFFPLEVKINAEDQDSQCYDYYNYAKRYNVKHNSEQFISTKIYYLTTSGYSPSSKSINGANGNLTSNTYVNISFQEDIYTWLKGIIAPMTSEEETLKSLLEHFLDNISEFVGRKDMYRSEEIIKELQNNPESMKAAHVVARSLDYAKEPIMLDIFERLQNRLCEEIEGNKNLQDLGMTYRPRDISLHAQVKNNIYKNHNIVLSFVLKNKPIANNVFLCFNIEAMESLFCGFIGYYIDPKDSKKNTLVEINHQYDSVVQKMIKSVVFHERSSWYYNWEYLTGSSSASEKINFAGGSDAFFELANEKKRTEFIDNCVKHILEAWLKPLYEE